MLKGVLYQPVYSILELLANTNSRNDKEEILRKNKHNKEIKNTFYYALNPFFQYGIKQIPEYEMDADGPGGATLSNTLKRLYVLYNRQKTGHAAQEWLRNQLESLSSDDAKVLELVIHRDLRCGVSEKTVNKIWPGLIPEFPNMLASPMKEETMKNISFPAYIQEKMDGQRVNLFCNTNGTVTVRTRNGKELEDLQNYFSREISNISSPVILDGELLVVDKNENYLPRKKSNGILSKIQKGTAKENEINSVRMVVWDIIPFGNFEEGIWKEPYKKRLQLLDNFLRRPDINTNGTLSLIETEHVDSLHEARSYFMNKIANGSEGAILKNQNHIWENGRSKEQLKMKADYSADLRVVDVIEGRGKYENFLGSFQLESDDGEVSVNVGSGFSDEDREVYFSNNMIGKIVTVSYNGVIDRDENEKKSLFLPIFTEVRNDKNETDSLKTLN